MLKRTRLQPTSQRHQITLTGSLSKRLTLRPPQRPPKPQRLPGVLPLLRVTVEPARGVGHRPIRHCLPVRCEANLGVLAQAAGDAHKVAHADSNWLLGV